MLDEHGNEVTDAMAVECEMDVVDDLLDMVARNTGEPLGETIGDLFDRPLLLGLVHDASFAETSLFIKPPVLEFTNRLRP
nr:hypothetical protein [Agromyces bauzanensis]